MRGFKGLLVVAVVAALLIPGSGTAGGRVRRCLGEPATIVGTRGADKIRGTSGEDVIVALGGADRISGLGGQEDSICGGRGSDTIYVSTKSGYDTCAGGDSHVSGGRGNDRIFGGGESFSAQGDKGDDLINGCSLGGIRIVTYFYSDTPVVVKLWNNFATGEGRDTLKNIKWVFGRSLTTRWWAQVARRSNGWEVWPVRIPLTASEAPITCSEDSETMASMGGTGWQETT